MRWLQVLKHTISIHLTFSVSWKTAREMAEHRVSWREAVA